MDTSALCCPVVYITVRNPVYRSQITERLRRLGWTVIEQPTGFHLIQALADLIEGHPWRKPELVIADAVSPGCSGLSIAEGLQDLGLEIPVVLLRERGQPVLPRAGIQVVDAEHAAATIEELARPHSPLHVVAAREPPRASA